jgi:hypothetical protein
MVVGERPPPNVTVKVLVYVPALRPEVLTLTFVVLAPALPVPDSALALSPKPLPAGMARDHDVGPPGLPGAVKVNIWEAWLAEPTLVLKTNCVGETEYGDP